MFFVIKSCCTTAQRLSPVPLLLVWYIPARDINKNSVTLCCDVMWHVTYFPASFLPDISKETDRTLWVVWSHSAGLPWWSVVDYAPSDVVFRGHAEKIKFPWKPVNMATVKSRDVAQMTKCSQKYAGQKMCFYRILRNKIENLKKAFLRYLSGDAFFLFSFPKRFLLFRQKLCFFSLLFLL